MIFGIYKRGQGKYTRLCSAFAAAIVAGLGCWQLYSKLEAVEWGLSRKAVLWVATMVPAGLFVVLALLISWLIKLVKQTGNSSFDVYRYRGCDYDGHTSWNHGYRL